MKPLVIIQFLLQTITIKLIQFLLQKQDKSLITARASSSQWQRPSLNDDDDDDDDDLVIAPSMSKQKRRELEDELM